MTTDDKNKDENLQLMLIKKHQKYHHYYQVKLINMSFLRGRNIAI